MNVKANAEAQNLMETQPPGDSELHNPAEVDSVDWSAVAVEPDEVEGDVEVLAAPEIEESAPEGEAKPVETPVAAEPVQVEPVGEEPAAVPEMPAAPVTAPFDMAKWEAESVNKLQELYKLSEEDARSLLTEPETVLPKLMAKAHMQMTKAVLESVQGIIPNVMETTQAATKAETEARNAFFSVNKDLAKPEYEQAILEAGAVYRRLNPKASRDEAVRRIGEMVRINFGLPLLSEQTKEVTPPQEPPKPFTPARGSTGGAAPAQKGQWEQLASEFENED